jgi:hypothetical protein
VNDPKSPPPSESDSSRDRRSPVRPTPNPPAAPSAARPAPPPDAPQRDPQALDAQASGAQPRSAPPESPTNPGSAMNTLRTKMEFIADEFAQGKINRAQFNAMYKRYSEQRTIIERLIERNPDSDAWKQVISVKGQTGFLRHHFAAQPLFYAVYRHHDYKPILHGGKQPPDTSLLHPVLKLVWSMSTRPKNGLGRKPLGESNWLILAVGDYAATTVVFSVEPSIAQARLVRDLHADFERANQAALARGWIMPERMVFPQRALVETGL